MLPEHYQKERLEEFRRRCRELGVPWTMQRRVILKAVLNLNSHPTAEEVYLCRSVHKSGISRATVYRTLENLVRMGFLTKVTREGGAVRYDGRTELHHHLICVECDAVIDFWSEELDAIRVPDTSAYGFTVTDARLQLRGICRLCKAQMQKHNRLKGGRDGNSGSDRAGRHASNRR